MMPTLTRRSRKGSPADDPQADLLYGSPELADSSAGQVGPDGDQIAAGNEPAKPMVPSAGFDLMHGAGRRRVATSRLNRRLALVAVLAVIGSALVAWQTNVTRDDLAADSESLTSEINQLTRDIVVASNSILNEDTLTAHRDSRRDALLTAAAAQLPYEIVIADMFDLASELGLTLRSVTLEGNRDEGLTVSGTAPTLDAIGEWSAALNTRFGVFRPGGYIETIANGYQGVPGGTEQQFSTRITPNTERLQTYASCLRARPFLGDTQTDCDVVFMLFEGSDTIGDGQPDALPEIVPVDVTGDGVPDRYEITSTPVATPPQFLNDTRYDMGTTAPAGFDAPPADPTPDPVLDPTLEPDPTLDPEVGP